VSPLSWVEHADRQESASPDFAPAATARSRLRGDKRGRISRFTVRGRRISRNRLDLMGQKDDIAPCLSLDASSTVTAAPGCRPARSQGNEVLDPARAYRSLSELGQRQSRSTRSPTGPGAEPRHALRLARWQVAPHQRPDIQTVSERRKITASPAGQSSSLASCTVTMRRQLHLTRPRRQVVGPLAPPPSPRELRASWLSLATNSFSASLPRGRAHVRRFPSPRASRSCSCRRPPSHVKRVLVRSSVADRLGRFPNANGKDAHDPADPACRMPGFCALNIRRQMATAASRSALGLVEDQPAMDRLAFFPA